MAVPLKPILIKKIILDVPDVPVQWSKEDWIDFYKTNQSFLKRVKKRLHDRNNESEGGGCLK